MQTQDCKHFRVGFESDVAKLRRVPFHPAIYLTNDRLMRSDRFMNENLSDNKKDKGYSYSNCTHESGSSAAPRLQISNRTSSRWMT